MDKGMAMHLFSLELHYLMNGVADYYRRKGINVDEDRQQEVTWTDDLREIKLRYALKRRRFWRSVTYFTAEATVRCEGKDLLIDDPLQAFTPTHPVQCCVPEQHYDSGFMKAVENWRHRSGIRNLDVQYRTITGAEGSWNWETAYSH